MPQEEKSSKGWFWIMVGAAGVVASAIYLTSKPSSSFENAPRTIGASKKRYQVALSAEGDKGFGDYAMSQYATDDRQQAVASMQAVAQEHRADKSGWRGITSERLSVYDTRTGETIDQVTITPPRRTRKRR